MSYHAKPEMQVVLGRFGCKFCMKKNPGKFCPGCYLMFFVVAHRHIGAVFFNLPMRYLSSTTTLRREGDEAWGLRVEGHFLHGVMRDDSFGWVSFLCVNNATFYGILDGTTC